MGFRTGEKVLSLNQLRISVKQIRQFWRNLIESSFRHIGNAIDR